MSATAHRVICPVCRRNIRQSRTRDVMLAHTDSTGKHCPMSGQAIGNHHDDGDE